MMTALIAHSFEGSAVRTMEHGGQPWFVLADVCRAMSLTNPTVAADKLDADEKMTLSLADGHSGKRGGAQSVTIVNEPGLYRIIMRSDKPQARRFQKWVFTDVLPAIRKTADRLEGDEKMTVSQTDSHSGKRGGALGVANSRDVANRLDDDEKGVSQTDTLGGAQSVTSAFLAVTTGQIAVLAQPEDKYFFHHRRQRAHVVFRGTLKRILHGGVHTDA